MKWEDGELLQRLNILCLLIICVLCRILGGSICLLPGMTRFNLDKCFFLCNFNLTNSVERDFFSSLAVVPAISSNANVQARILWETGWNYLNWWFKHSEHSNFNRTNQGKNFTWMNRKVDNNKNTVLKKAFKQTIKIRSKNQNFFLI